MLDQPHISENIPSAEKGPLLKELKKANDFLSDVGGSQSQIDVLIGKDVAGKFVVGEMV